jgi:hypothetical protein
VQDAIAEFLRAPLWAQIAMAAFALLVVVSVAGPFFKKRRFSGRFKAIAQALSASSPQSVDGRARFQSRLTDAHSKSGMT